MRRPISRPLPPRRARVNEGRKLRGHYVDKKGRKRKRENRIPLLLLLLSLPALARRRGAHLNGQLTRRRGLADGRCSRKDEDGEEAAVFRHGGRIKHLLEARALLLRDDPFLFCFALLSFHLAAAAAAAAGVTIFAVVVSLP